jgi:hypothetical protein
MLQPLLLAQEPGYHVCFAFAIARLKLPIIIFTRQDKISCVFRTVSSVQLLASLEIIKLEEKRIRRTHLDSGVDFWAR